MDGRTQIAVNEWLRQRYDADFVDTITEPGPDKVLAELDDTRTVASIRHRLAISVEKHGSRVVAIVGHHDCAGNPVDRAEHLRQLAAAAETVKTWGFPVTVVRLWLGEDWRVEPLD